MTNRGYPFNYAIDLRGTPFLIVAKGADVCLIEETDGGVLEVGLISKDQASALVFHLLFWGGGLKALGQIPDLVQLHGKRVGPKFRNPECLYEF